MQRNQHFIFLILLILLAGGYFYKRQYEVVSLKVEPSVVENVDKVESAKAQEVSKINLEKPLTVERNSSKIDTSSELTLTKKAIEEKAETEHTVLSLDKEKIKLEITLIDGLKNQVLSVYPVEIRYVDKNGIEQREKLKSDTAGKLILETTTLGLVFLQILTNDYAIYAKQISIALDENKIVAVLFKGGTLEIKAVNEKNEIIMGLMVKFDDFDSQNYRPLIFDSVKGVYIFSQFPFDRPPLKFKAEGYLAKEVYNVFIDFEKPTQLRIILEHARKINIDLELKNKPAFIQIEDDDTFVNNCSTGESHSLAKEIVSVPLNKDGKYEFYFDRFFKNIIVNVEKYVPMRLEIKADQNSYKLIPFEGFVGKIQVVDETGAPVQGAKVFSYADSELEGYKNTSLTNKDGFVVLSCLYEKMDLHFEIYHIDYGIFLDQCSFNENAPRLHLIEICKRVRVSGKIYFDKKPVAGAEVVLCVESDEFADRGICKTEADGSFSFYAPKKDKFNEVEDRKDLVFFLRACHPKYGIGKSPTFKVENTSQMIDFSLICEKGLTVKLVDLQGKPIKDVKLSIKESGISITPDSPNKFDCLLSFYNFEHESAAADLTNEIGECVFYTLWSGSYNVILDSDKFAIQKGESEIEIPSEKIVITAIEKLEDKIILKVLTPSGEPYTGLIFPLHSLPNESFLYEKSYYTLNMKSINIVYDKFIFTVPGYAPIRIGPYKDCEPVPKEINIKLVKGENILVKVIDFKTKEEIPFVTVNIDLEGESIKSMQTNEKGEVEFSGLWGELFLKISAENYAPYDEKFDCNKTKEILVKLIKGGIIKGHLSIGEDVESFKVSLSDNEQQPVYGENGEFEFHNLAPGEYFLCIKKTYKNNSALDANSTLSVIVENEKIIDLNLDALQPSKLILTLPPMNLDSTLEKLKNSKVFISDRSGAEIFSQSLEKSIGVPISIMPGEYKLKSGGSKNIIIKSQQINTEEIDIQENNLVVTVKDESGRLILDVFVHAIVGEKYSQLDSQWTWPEISDAEYPEQIISFCLSPKTKYCFFIEPYLSLNFQSKAFGPIELKANGHNAIEFVLSNGRKLPKIQIVDDGGNPIEGAEFIYYDSNGNFLKRYTPIDSYKPFSDINGFLPENGWPKESFRLIVSKEGFEFKETIIPENINPEIVLQIKLKKASSIQCDLKKLLPVPVTIGILNSSGVLIERPMFFRNTYFTNIAFGRVSFTELSAGTYYIGYFENGSTKVISKQGPFTIGVEENLEITSTFK